MSLHEELIKKLMKEPKTPLEHAAREEIRKLRREVNKLGKKEKPAKKDAFLKTDSRSA